MKNVLGLVISHRKLGNSEILVKEIMSSIPEDSKLELIRLTDMKIEACKACYRCLQADTQCPAQDDFNFIMKRIKEADALIIGVPIYLLGPHGSYKMLCDRLAGAFNYAKFTAGKPCLLVMPYGIKGWLGYSRAAALVLPRLLQMKIIDLWQVHATLPGESLLALENLDYARALGAKLFSAQGYTPGIRECSQCGSDLFRLLPNNKIECPICNSKGVIERDNIPLFSDCNSNRFSPQEIEEHFNGWLIKMKDKFFREKDRLKEVQKAYQNKNWWV